MSGIEAWTNGEHDYLKHQVPSKRGLSPDARQYVTEHYRESQRAILDGLIDGGLINPLEANSPKLKQQIKRRKLTVKTNRKIQRSLALQNDPDDVYHITSSPMDMHLLRNNSVTAEDSIDGSIVGGVCLDNMAVTEGHDVHNQDHNEDHHHIESSDNDDDHYTHIHEVDELAVAAAEAAASSEDFIYKDPSEHMPTFV